MKNREVDRFTSANRRWTVRITMLLIVLCSMSIGQFPFARDRYAQYQISRLIRAAYDIQRPGGGRLFRAPYLPMGRAPANSDLGRAQLLLLRLPNSQERWSLQNRFWLASGNWRTFIEKATGPRSKGFPGNAETMNNLGVSFLALSDSNPTYLLKALEQFELSAQLEPRAPEPRFNMVVTYRKLRLGKAADEMLQRYAGLEPYSPWYRELTDSGEVVDESAILNDLRRAVEGHDSAEAERLFQKNPELCRRVAMQYGTANIVESEELVRFIANQIERRFGDRTVSAMIDPLFTNRRSDTIALRKLVTEGARLFGKGDFPGSLRAYDKADGLIGRSNSLFDRLWIDLNRVDTQIRTGEFGSARESLHRLVASAREQDFRWLEGRALSIYGSSLKLTATYQEMLQRLGESDRVFVEIAARYERVRPLYYLAAYESLAGDHDEALRLALECLRLTDDEPLRMSALDWLVGSTLYRQGMPSRAVLFETESAEQTAKLGHPSWEATAAINLAQLYESMSEHAHAEEHVKAAEEALGRTDASAEQVMTELLIGSVKARIDLNRKRYEEAESLLTKNLNLFSKQPFRATALLAELLMLRARTYAETGRITDAKQTFNKAIEVVENDDQYLQSEKLRVKFDDARRELYDSAIEFEYSHGSPDAAWTYLQKYRAKLFLEFLAQFNSDIGRVHGQALDRAKVQKLVPPDTQVIEYALLKDQLLIWLVSDKFFTLRSVPVTRSALEGQVQEVLQRLRNGEDAGQLLEDLGKVLIEPVANLLDPGRTLAIIPDRALHGLPFDALRHAEKKQYLVEDFAVIVSPSLTHLLATTAGRPARDAIVSFGSQDDDSSEIKELTALRDIYSKVTTFAGEKVDKPKFLHAMTMAPIFHYAGHSVTDAVDPLRSSILLDGNRYGPNSVTAVDIAQRRMWDNAVVVLSSCDSAVGNSRDGVGMRGLTSAFLIGGAGSVVGSLWPVEASSTAELMIGFHRAFASANIPVAQALRQAQLRFMKSFPERSHPYYWSGFVVTGNFSALR